jgi:hypothetical protein
MAVWSESTVSHECGSRGSGPWDRVRLCRDPVWLCAVWSDLWFGQVIGSAMVSAHQVLDEMPEGFAGGLRVAVERVFMRELLTVPVLHVSVWWRSATRRPWRASARGRRRAA